MFRLVALVLLASVVTGCSQPASSNEQALEVWEKNLASAQKIAESGEGSERRLRQLEDFFYGLTGQSGIAIAHHHDILTVSPQAEEAVRELRQWCEENCSRLSIDPESGEVIALAEEAE